MLVGLTACSGEGGFDPEEHFGQTESWIINGQIDTEHDAVVALFSGQSGCTGTIIHVDGGNAYILTAAHCFGFGPIQQAAMGDNYQQATAVFNVVDYQIHPQYDPSQEQPPSPFDFAVLRATGANAGTPIIPPLTPYDDALAAGTPVLHVGYGLVSWPNGSTSQRHKASGVIDQVAPSQFAYNQPVAGPCSGDSGGPNLADMGSGERVAGVISYGDQSCEQFGVSGRASAVYTNFIVPFIGYDPYPPTTTGATTSSTTATTGSGATTGAGGAPTGPSAGAGAEGPIEEGWLAGNATEKDYDGELLTPSGCAMAPRRGSDWGWLMGAVIALGASLRRRSSW